MKWEKTTATKWNLIRVKSVKPLIIADKNDQSTQLFQQQISFVQYPKNDIHETVTTFFPTAQLLFMLHNDTVRTKINAVK